MTNLQQLRRNIIKQRKALTPSEQHLANTIISQQLIRNNIFIGAKRIAFYFSHKGEVDTSAVLKKALSMKKECYFPILHPIKHNLLWFGRYHGHDKLTKNNFGILEPDLKKVECIPAWCLDLVLTPLVAFDKIGHRVGMGRGFYDRTFYFKNQQFRKAPFLFGLAYDFQETDIIQPHNWDVPLDAVLTETRYLPFYKPRAIEL